MSVYVDSSSRLHHDQERALALPCPHCQAWVSPEREHLTGWQGAESQAAARTTSVAISRASTARARLISCFWPTDSRLVATCICGTGGWL